MDRSRETLTIALLALLITGSGCISEAEGVAMPLRRRGGVPSTSPSPAPRLDPLPQRIPNDPRFSFQNGLKSSTDFDVDGPEAWGLQTDCQQVRIAVVDTGVDASHPELEGSVWTNPNEVAGDGVDNDGNGFVDDVRGWNFAGGNGSAQDDHMHGTHVAGIIGAAGDNGAGIAGLCWSASVVPLKAFDAAGDGFTSDIIEAVDYAAQMNFRVINASFGTPSYSGTLKILLEQIADEGFLLVASAGNESSNNDTTPSYPASYPVRNVIAVASLNTSTGAISSFSNYGRSVHIAAPGSSIYSTTPMTQTPEMIRLSKRAQYEYLSGTSMAAPFVSATAALLWSYDTTLTMGEVRDRILSRAETREGFADKVEGNRMLRARKVLEP